MYMRTHIWMWNVPVRKTTDACEPSQSQKAGKLSSGAESPKPTSGSKPQKVGNRIEDKSCWGSLCITLKD